jgi:hypothetical protein
MGGSQPLSNSYRDTRASMQNLLLGPPRHLAIRIVKAVGIIRRLYADRSIFTIA